MKSVWNARQTSVPRVVSPLLSLLPFPLPSRHVNRIPAGGYPIAEKGYKNRINRVYDVAKGEDNATKANISESSEMSHPRAIDLERISARDFLGNRVGGSFP